MSRGFSLSLAFFIVGVLTVGALFDVLPLLLLGFLGIVTLYAMGRWPRVWGFAALAFAPMIGWMLAFSLPRSSFSEQAFAGSIDIPFADAVAILGLLAMVFELTRTHLWRWWARRLPFVWSYAALVFAHLASVFSASRPDMYGVIKFALRPVAFSYLAFVALPQAVIRTWSDARRVVGLFVAGASVFAIQGLVSLVVDERLNIGTLHRARPLPIAGVYPIGANHNVLAEWLVVAAPFALALAEWTHDRRVRRVSMIAAGLCAAVALLTFARSAWIVLALQALVVLCSVQRAYLARVGRMIVRGGWMILLPLVGYMGWFSLRQEVASSTDARAMLTGIAWRWFSLHPFLGAGAGTFVERVGGTKGYQLLFGGPMDAHGVIQKLLAETGLLGLFAYGLVSFVIARLVWVHVQRVGIEHRIGRGLAYAAVGVLGAWSYQLFNTTYWSAKLWLPIGIFFAIVHLYRKKSYV